MKLLCINNRELIIKGRRALGSGLEEGKEYETKGEPFVGDSGGLCYYIKGIGSRLCCRFTKVIEEQSVAEIAVEKLKREFQLN